MLAEDLEFFAEWGGGGDLLDRYFEAARFWRETAMIFALPPPDLRLFLKQAERLIALEKTANG